MCDMVSRAPGTTPCWKEVADVRGGTTSRLPLASDLLSSDKILSSTSHPGTLPGHLQIMAGHRQHGAKERNLDLGQSRHRGQIGLLPARFLT